MLIRRICILKLGTRAERFNEEGFCEATIQEPQRIPQLPDVAQGVASLEWISGIDFPSRYAGNPSTAADCWHDRVVLTNLGWIVHLAKELCAKETHV